MANEAFALSPISARATFPGEEDYAAISEAFMETARGRWFLAEYAKRNRNADTRMVLDAVARIEQGLAAQKTESLAAQREAVAAAAAAETSRKEAKLAEARLAEARLAEARLAEAELAQAKLAEARLAEAELAQARLAEARLAEARLAEARLAEAMAAIRHAIEAAQASAVEALDGLALNERLAPVRKGARVLREIAWRLREIGNDGRICDLIDSQVGLIEKGAEQIISDEARDEAKAALGAAFASIDGRLAEFSGDATQAPVADARTVSPAPSPQAATAATEPEHEALESPTGSISTDTATSATEAPVAAADDVLEEMASADTVELSTEAADALDDAVLDAIAMEMGVEDPIDDDEIFASADSVHPFTEAPAVEPEIVAELPEPIVAPVKPAVQAAPQPMVQSETPPEAVGEISLGSSIIASGIVRRPGVAANDPLAAIRRMSQAEKIAFFS